MLNTFFFFMLNTSDLCSFLTSGSLWWPQHSLACGHITSFSACLYTAFSSPSVCLSKGKLSLRLGPTWIVQNDLKILNIYKDPFSNKGWVHKFQGSHGHFLVTEKCLCASPVGWMLVPKKSMSWPLKLVNSTFIGKRVFVDMIKCLKNEIILDFSGGP